jgi:hypothetical protein
LSVDLAPVDACPSVRPLGSVCVIFIRHRTFPSMCNFHIRSLGDSPSPRQPPFGVGIYPIQPVIIFPGAFRLLAFASWIILFPLRNYPFLTVGLLGCMPDLIGVLTFRTPELRLGWVLSVLRRLGVPIQGSKISCTN